MLFSCLAEIVSPITWLDTSAVEDRIVGVRGDDGDDNIGEDDADSDVLFRG